MSIVVQERPEIVAGQIWRHAESGYVYIVTWAGTGDANYLVNLGSGNVWAVPDDTDVFNGSASEFEFVANSLGEALENGAIQRQALYP